MNHQTKWDSVELSINRIIEQLSHCNEYVLPYDLVLKIENVKKEVDNLEKQLIPFIKRKQKNRIKIYDAVMKYRSTKEGKRRQKEINEKWRNKVKIVEGDMK